VTSGTPADVWGRHGGRILDDTTLGAEATAEDLARAVIELASRSAIWKVTPSKGSRVGEE
jgi:hypothetical protein